MHQKRKKKLYLILFLLAGLGIAVGLALYALSSNINLFFDPTQIQNGEAPQNVKIRMGGMVVEDSVKRDPDSLKVQFDLTDFESIVTVEFEGILPDLFREGQGIVALGKLDSDNKLVADEVLAKHDENYMPPEVAEALKEKHKGVEAMSGKEGYQHDNGAASYPPESYGGTGE